MAKNRNPTLKFDMLYEVEVRDKNGRLLSRQKGKAHSWLRQWIQILKGHFATRFCQGVGHANVSIIDETGTGRDFPYHSAYAVGACYHNLSTLGDAGDTSQGLIVGSGSTPNSLTTYALASKIAHGTTSGRLLYGAESIEDVTNPSGMDLQFRITRTFTNNSGETVTVKEFGLLVQSCDSGTAPRSFLVAREVLPSPSSIPDGATMTIRYIIKLTVS